MVGIIASVGLWVNRERILNYQPDSRSELSLEEYFTQLKEAAQDFDSAGEALGEDFDERLADAGDDIEGAIGIFQEFFDEATAIFEDFVNRIEELNPPEEAADAHEEAVSAGRETVEAFEQLTSDLDGVETEEEFLEVVENAEDPSTDFSAACEELQTIAEDNEIDVDLQCDGAVE